MISIAMAGIADNVIETIVAFGLLCITVTALVALFRHPYWSVRLRGFFRRPFAMLFLFATILYVAVAWSDSISWKDDLGKDRTGLPLEASEPRSLLDRMFAAAINMPEYEYHERSYSSPLASHEFTDDNILLEYKHLLGTTQTGKDTLYHVLKGCRPAIVIGTLPLLIAVPLAMLFGIAGGFFGGRIDDLVVYCFTTLASIPGLLLMIALIAALGHGLPQIAIGLGVTGWIGLCRLVRGETLKLRELEYIQAATCLGVPKWRIILRHIVPNLMHIIIITAILAFTGLVLTESILSYLGIGLDHSWGAMIDHARSELSRDPPIWWNFFFASMSLFILVLSVNVIGDTLREVLDPRSATETGA